MKCIRSTWPKLIVSVMLMLSSQQVWGSEGPAAPSRYNIVPWPQELEERSGAFMLNERTQVALSDPENEELRSIAGFLAEMIRHTSGFDLPVATRPGAGAADNTVAFLLDESIAGPEAYRLTVSTQSVTVEAGTPAGLFYGVQTLRQLLPVAVENEGAAGDIAWSIPAVAISDAPRFSYRGMHLDMGRHFFPIEFIKKYIDLLALYKMNTFHWHLTEDQGWRIEIKQYPKLTEVGAYRKETIVEKNFDPYVGDKTPYGGFYTQEEIRDVVAYAQVRYVTIIPEIELPGHSLAALAAYPELACTPGPFEVGTVWGVYEDIYCPKEETFTFLENVLTEVMALFPSEYIHIGGDEAPKDRWKESPVAQAVIKREGLKDEHELQSYFIRRIEKFLNAHGRQLIGWDEILEGGLAPGATVMSWRGTSGGVAAARQGHDVVMTPNDDLYFDHYQGDPQHEPLAIGGMTTLEDVYRYEPIPEVLTEDQARHVLGAQANVWTEYMKTSDHVEYMVFPRLLALSEVVWSPRSVRDWESFVQRLPEQFRRLGALGVNYRIPPVEGLEHDRLVMRDRVTVTLQSPVPFGEIRYTTDGSTPTATSILYPGPFVLDVDEQGTVVSALVFGPDGRFSPLRQARLSPGTLRPAERISQANLTPGLKYAYYEGRFASVDALRNDEPERAGIVPSVSLKGDERQADFGVKLSGYLRVPADGIYTFYLISDDGSKLYVGNDLVIDHDGPHGPTEASGMAVLQAGYHPITIHYFQGEGGAQLRLEVASESQERVAIPSGWLLHRR